MKRFITAFAFCFSLLLVLSFVLFPPVEAKEDVLMKLLDLPAPPPPNPLAKYTRPYAGTDYNKRTPPPKDDAPIIPTTIRFFNHSVQRKLVRLTPLGRSPASLTLEAEASYEQTTIPGEPWMVTDMNDACVAIYVAAPVRSTVTIR